MDLGVDGKGVQNGLGEINNSINQTQKELNLLKNGLKLEFDSDKFKRAQELAQKQVEQSRLKVEQLRKAIEEADRQGVDKTTNAFKQLERELLQAENAAKKAEIQLKEINDIKYDKMVAQANKLNGAVDKVGQVALVTAAALTAVSAGVTKLGLDAIKTADDIATTADQLGISTTALQKYQYIAMQTDVSQEALSKSIVKINGDIGNLALGIEDNGNKALRALIGDFKNLDGTIKTSEQAFQEVMSALAGIENQAERTGLANLIFGERFAKDLNPLLNQGVEGWKRYSEEFEKVGFISEENIKKFTEIDNKLNETRAIFKQISAETAIDLMPLFEEFTDLIKENKEEIADFASAFITKFIDIIKIAYESRDAIAAVTSVVIGLKVFSQTVIIIDGLTKALQGAAVAQGTLNAVSSANPYIAVGTALLAVIGLLGTYAYMTNKATDETDKLNKEVINLISSYEKAEESAYKVANSEQAKLTVVERLIPELEELANKTDRTTDENNRLHSIISDLNQAMPDLKLAIDNETGALNRQINVIYDAVQAYKDLARAKALSNVMVKGEEAALELEIKRKEASDTIRGAEYNADFYRKEGEEKSEEYKTYDRNNLIQKEYDRKVKLEVKRKAEAEKIVADIDNQLAVIKTRNEEYAQELKKLQENANKTLDEVNPDRQQTGGQGKYSDLLGNKEKELQTQRKKALADAEKAEKERQRLEREAEREAERQSKEAEKERQEAIRKELQDLRFRRDMDLIDEFNYYVELVEYRDKYFEEGSSEWQSYTLEIYNWQKKLREESIKNEEKRIQDQKKALEKAEKDAEESFQKQLKILQDFQSQKEKSISDSLRKEQDSIKSSTNYKIAHIEKEYDAQKKLLNAKIDGINLEIQKRKELREDENQDDRINKIKKEIEVLQAKIKFERDPENALQLGRELARKQQELAGAFKDKEDTLFYREKAEEKQAIQERIEILKQESDRKKELARIEEQEAIARAEAQARRDLNQNMNVFRASASNLNNQYYNYNNANTSYDYRTNSVNVYGGTLTSAALANYLNKK